VGIVGEKSFAQDIRDRIKIFLETTLKLELSLEKTKLTHMNDDRAKFLGAEIHVPSPRESKQVVRTTASGKKIPTRVNHVRVYLEAPIQKIMDKLRTHGFIDGSSKPQAISK